MALFSMIANRGNLHMGIRDRRSALDIRVCTKRVAPLRSTISQAPVAAQLLQPITRTFGYFALAGQRDYRNSATEVCNWRLNHSATIRR